MLRRIRRLRHRPFKSSTRLPLAQEGCDMRVIIAGSRGINDYAAVCDAVQRSGFTISRVVSGMAAGVDTLAIRYATENALPLDPYPPQWSKWGRSAGYKR